MSHIIKKNSIGNVKRSDVERMGIRYKQWLRMSSHRQNRRINRHNLLQELLDMYIV